MAAPARKPGRRAATERAAVREIVKQHLGGRIHRVEKQSGGLSNLVYLVEHSEGEFIVRLNRDQAKLNPFLKEQWATARARKIGIPAPEVLEVGHVPVPHMILSKSPGGTGNVPSRAKAHSSEARGSRGADQLRSNARLRRHLRLVTKPALGL
jgi:hypothetical protein